MLLLQAALLKTNQANNRGCSVGKSDRLALASVLVEKLKTSLDRSGTDKVKFGCIVLRKDAVELYSLVEQWERHTNVS